MNIDGSGVTLLSEGTDNPTRGAPTCFSPDGKRIAFSDSGQVYIINANRTNRVQLTTNTKLKNNSHPSWSPDGVRTGSFSGVISCSLNSTPIFGATVEAFQGTAAITSTVTDASGKFILQNLVAEPYFIRASAPGYDTQCVIGTISIIAGTDTPISLSLTPVVKGGMVAFSSNRDGAFHIYLMNASGTPTIRLTPDIQYTGTATPPGYYSPNLSSDGRQIAFSSDVSGNNDIYLMDTNGLNMVQLTIGGSADDSPCFSPDGKFIAFVSGKDICLKNIAAGTMTTLLKGNGTITTPCFSPDGTRLIFCLSKDGLSQIYSLDIPGTNTRNLTGSSSTNLSPSLSPDRRQIVFSSNRDGERYRLYLMDINGRNQQCIPINLDSDLHEPCFSPDGKQIIFWANNPDLYTVNLDGSGLTQLTFGTASDTKPSWSAGGVGSGWICGNITNQSDGFAVPGATINIYQAKQLVATNITDVFGHYTIPDVYIGEYMLTASYPGRYALKRVASPVRVISDMAAIVNAAIMPIGNKNGKIVFTAQRNEGTGTEIYIMNADGSNQQQLTSGERWKEAGSCSHFYQPCLSPDGQKIAFVSDIGGGNDDIYIINSDASNKIRLTTSNTQDNNPSFSSDSKKIVYSTGNSIRIIDLETIQQQAIIGSTTIGSTTGYFSPSFSPDGQRIIFTNRLSQQDENIYICNVNGSNTVNLTGSSSRNHSPTFSPDGLKIAFVSNRDANENVYIMDADGSHQGRLTSNTAENLSPSFSPDGQRVTFYSNRDGNNEIYTVDVEGRDTQRLTNNLTNDFQPSWGPGDVGFLVGSVSGVVSRLLNSIPIYRAKVAVYHGQTLIAATTTNINGTYSIGNIPTGTCTIIASHPEYICKAYEGEVNVIAQATTADINLSLPYFRQQGIFAFTSERDGNPEVYTMNGDNSNQQRLTFNLTEDIQPTLSMDGTKIAFVSDSDGNKEIYIMDEEGNGQKRLTISEGEDSHPSMSADGDKIAFCSKRDGNKEIYIMNLDGSGQTRLTKDLMGYSNSDPCLSRDGGKIVFVSNRDGNKEIYVCNADGSGQKRLTNNLYADYDPCISPDGKRIVYTCTANGNEEILIMNVDGTAVKTLTNNPAHDYDPQFSPDGTRIAFCSDRDGFKRIYIMDLDGEGLTPLINLEPNDHLSPIMNQDSLHLCWVSGGYGQASIAGKVISAKNMEAVFGARIEAIQGSAAAGAASCGPTGKYTIFGLTPGIYRLRVSATGYATQFLEEAIVVRQDQVTVGIDFSIIPIGSRGGKIAFISDRSGSKEIFVMNADGTNQTRLTHDNYNNYTPEFSSDGKKIVFISDRTGYNEIYIMDADGTGQERLTHSLKNNQSPAFLPDGRQIIFSSNLEFMIMNDDGTQQKRFEANLTGESTCFSPDGTRIVFTSDKQIYISSKDGVNLATITNGLLQEAEPVFSPSGETIAFTGVNANDQEGYLFNLEQRTITGLTQSWRSDAISAYSPDGKRIAFTTDRDNAGKGEIYSMALDGSCQMRLTNNNSNDYQPSWAPGDVGPGTISGVVVSRGDAENAEKTKKSPTIKSTADSVAVSDNTATDAAPIDDTAMIKEEMADTVAVSAATANAAAIKGALIEVLQDGKVIASTRTDANGQYVIPHLAGGNYSLRCSAPPEYGVKSLTQEATIAMEDKTLILNLELFPIGTNAGRIVFVSNQEIYSVYPDGSGLLRLTDNQADDHDPNISPDGSTVVFVSDNELCLMNIDGTCQMRLTGTGINKHSPSFSSDGKQIVFCSDTNIFVMNSDGSGMIQLTDGINSVSCPSFSPEETKIVFASNGNICTIPLCGSSTAARMLTANSGVNIDPSFSPDGTKIAFASDRDGNFDIYLMNTDGTNQTMITNNLNKNTKPAFSPDGARIVFCTQLDANSKIAMIDVDGKSPRLVMDNAINNYSPCWGVEYCGSPVIHGSLSVNTIPSGAWIYLDGAATNKITPAVLSVALGTHTITLTRDWCETWKDMIVVNKEQAVSLDVVLCGSISITSDPSGAAVFIDGTTTTKTTPCSLSMIPSGTHTITLSKDGYETWVETITLSTNTTTLVNASLRVYGSISITSTPSEAAIFLDGIAANKTTPAALTNVPYGTHTITLIKDGCQVWSGTITVSTSTTLILNATLTCMATNTQTVVRMRSTLDGKNICTDISIANAGGKLCGANLVLQYDITKMSVDSITKGDALSGLPNLFFDAHVVTTTGTIDISMAVLGVDAVIPDGYLLRINSRVTTEEEITPDMAIIMGSISLRNTDNVPIPYQLISEHVTVGSTTPPLGTGTMLILSPSVIPVNAGDVFPVDIVAKNVTDLSVAELHLLFDPQLLQVMDSNGSSVDGIQIKNGGLFGEENVIRNTVDNDKGLIQFTSLLLFGTATGNGTIATIILKSIRGGTSTISFNLNAVSNQETKLLNDHTSIPFTMTTATITAAGGWNSGINGVVGILEAGSFFFTDKITVTLNNNAGTTTDKFGHFSFSGIAPGTYTLTADIPGSSLGTRSRIMVAENEQVNIGTISLLAGDANNDGMVNGSDLLVLRNAFGSIKGETNWNPEADFKPDDSINGYDLLTLRHNFGSVSQNLAPIMLPVQQLTAGSMAATASLSIEPQSINPTINSIFTVRVRVADVKDLAVAELHLEFNPDVLEVVDADVDTPDTQIIPGDFPAKAGTIKNQVNNQTGRIDFTSYLLSGAASGSGVLAVISFRAKAVGTCGITIGFNTMNNRETKVLSPKGAINIIANDAQLGVSLVPLSDRFINVKAYPNPLIIGLGDEIKFEGLPNVGMVDVKIYNIAGELVWDESVPAPSDGKWRWDAKNNDNEPVASGVYIYLMTNEKDRTVGKMAVIR
ncbi:MAG: carboxypeptidase regulatory-like domain-containing protein [bacterium]